MDRTYLVAVRIEGGVGWSGQIRASSPLKAASEARKRHRPSNNSYTYFRPIRGIEIRDTQGNLIGHY